MSENTPLLKRTTTWKMCKLIDLFEPVLIVGCVLGGAGFVYSAITGNLTSTVLTGIVFVSSCVGEWRVRTLGVAKELMDSVNTLQEENDKLKIEVQKFEEIMGIFDNNVEDLDSVKNQLFELYNKYKTENQRYESNNLLTLFGLIDKNQDSKLDTEEINRMKEYIRIVYKEEFDFDLLDKDNDGCISLTEFFEKFRNARETTDQIGHAKDNDDNV